MRKLFLLIMLLLSPLAHSQVLFKNITTNPSAPIDADKMVDETGTTTYLNTYLANAKYIVAKFSGDCTVNSSFTVSCLKINGLTFPALVNGDCLSNNGTALQWAACGSGGGASTFDQLGTGTNTTATMVCSTGCSLGPSGSGTLNANQIGGVAVPASASLVGTNASSQLVDIEPTATGCIGVSAGQIYVNCMVLPQYTIGTLPTCSGPNEGLEAYVTNGAAVPTYLGTVSTTGSTVAPVFCNGSNWIYH